jgi:hypothetical protein
MGCKSSSDLQSNTFVSRGNKVGLIDLNQHPQITFPPEEQYNIDLCFMIDCTVEMQPYITMLTSKLADLYEKIKSKTPKGKVRIAVVAYRDVKDKLRFEVLSFTDSQQEIRSFVEKLKAQGGNDAPDDVNGGFQKSLFEIEWKSMTKVLYHITDAPAHGYMFHDLKDDHPYGYELDKDWKLIFRRLKDLKVSYTLFDIEGKTQKMFEKFKEMYEEEGGVANNIVFEREVLNTSQNKIKMYDEAFAKKAVDQALAHQKSLLSK